MRKKTLRIILSGLIAVVIICIGVFTWIASFMSGKSQEAISKIGNIYMSEVSKQIQKHFSTTIQLRLSQVNGILERVSLDAPNSRDELYSLLLESGDIRGFTNIALLSNDGAVKNLLGELEPKFNDNGFSFTLASGEEHITTGLSASGEELLILGIPAKLPINNEEESIALIAALPLEQLNDALSLSMDNTLVYSHILRFDGSYVVKNDNSAQDNYFNKLSQASDVSGNTAAQIDSIKQAVTRHEDISFTFAANGQSQHIYLMYLPSSDWYLCTIMPFGTLDQTIVQLGNDRTYTVIIGCVILILTLLTLFLLYARLTYRQLTALEKAQKAAQEASRAKSDFLSNMSHDIRTPMNAIMGMTEIASAHLDNQAQVKDCLKKISTSSRHLLGLINDVLDMSKIENGKLTLNPELMSLRENVDNIINIIQPQVKSRQQHFDVFIHNIEHEKIYCDSVRLNQVLLNLLSNAIKFTPDKGTITIDISEVPSSRGTGYVQLCFIVKDTGIGMSEKFQKDIFQAFAREQDSRVNKIEGTGLGMAITKYIVDMMEGTITVHSKEGQGTEFKVILDMEIPDQNEEAMKLPGWHILVLDDDEQLCQSAAHTLNEMGAFTDWTCRINDALSMICQRNQTGEDYEVVLIDWQMPEPDGVQAAKKIRESVGDTIPIIVISAYDWSNIEAEARRAGVNGFISKPLFKSTLYYGLKNIADKNEVLPGNKDNSSCNFHGARLLVAEDNDLNLEIANELLSEFNLCLDRADNGQICVEMFNASAPDEYKAILMDIRMPVMDGYEATRQIRSSSRPDSGLPIIAMTADAFSEDIKECFNVGMNGHIAKPIDISQLCRMLTQYITPS